MSVFGKVNAFLLGAREFRLMCTSHVVECDAYDLGREWAHRVTFRIYDEWKVL